MSSKISTSEKIKGVQNVIGKNKVFILTYRKHHTIQHTALNSNTIITRL